MIDIVALVDGKDMQIQDTIVPKASNLLTVQLGSLEYAPDFGIDIDYFLNNTIAFQNASFKAYLVEKMAQNLINVTEVLEILEKFEDTLQFRVSPNENTNGGMII